MAARVVGLDLGSYGVRAVELTVGNGRPTLERFAQVTLPPGAVRDGEVVDPGAVSASIRRLWSEGGFKSKRVAIGVANQRVIVRLAEMPTMTDSDLQASLQYEAQELIPIPVDDAILDFQILDDAITPHDGDPRMRVLLAAAQRDMVRNHLAAAEAAGLRTDVVDVVPFAMVRALSVSANPFEFDGGAEAIVCIGGGVTNVVVHEQGVPRFVRVLLVGGDDVTDAIARELDVPVDQAEALKRQADITSLDPGVARAGQVVRDRLAPLVEEVRGSLDYYLAQSQSSTIDRILVTGGGSRMPGLMERLQGQLGANVEPARPLAGLQIGKNVGLSDRELSDIESLLTVPIGLALAGESQKGLRRINLVPREVAVGREQRRQVVLAGAGVAVLATLLVGAWGARGGQLSDERHRADTTELQAQALEHEVGTLGDTIALDKELTERRSQVTSVLANDVAWTKLFNEVATVLPSDVWLTTFTGSHAGELTFSAKGFDQTSTARWLQRMADIKSLSGLWVPTSTKEGTGPLSTVTFTSDANLTPAAISNRAQRYLEEKP
ncbi:MAG TPA: type IV pilus assembly protein PilM [Acidimicrobiales bacterium]|nr:type IV pilus assembly protein PilM [Acidimicrobiales bacterium]